VLGVPMVDDDNLVIVSRALSADWDELLLGRVDWDLADQIGRSFRPLPVLSYRIDQPFVDDLGAGHRQVSLAVMALLAAAIYGVIARLAGPLSRYESILAGALSAAVPVSFAGAGSSFQPTDRSNAFLALSYVALVGVLLTGRGRFGLLRTAALALAVLGCALSKESGAFLAAGFVVVWAAAALWRRSESRRSLSVAGATTAASLGAFYLYKLASLGWNDLVVPGKKATLTDTAWGIPPLDSLIARLDGEGASALALAVLNTLRNCIGIAVPVFNEIGLVEERRVPFLLPSIVLLGAVLVVAGRGRAPTEHALVLLAAAAAIAAAGTYIGYRSRWVLPGSAVWTIATGVAIVVLARRYGRALPAAAAAAVVAVSMAFGYHAAAQQKVWGLDILYRPVSLQSPVYDAVLNEQRRKYACAFVADYRLFLTRRTAAERIAETVAGLRLFKSPQAKAHLPAVEERCRAS
jgi:hypothetical protein